MDYVTDYNDEDEGGDRVLFNVNRVNYLMEMEQKRETIRDELYIETGNDIKLGKIAEQLDKQILILIRDNFDKVKETIKNEIKKDLKTI